MCQFITDMSYVQFLQSINLIYNIPQLIYQYFLISIQMNKKIILQSHPDQTFPKNLSFFKLQYQQIPQLKPRQLLLKILYISIDPVARVWVSGAKSYLPAIKPGMDIPAFGIARIIQSKSKKFLPGSLVIGVLSWSSYIIKNQKEVSPIVQIQRPYRYLSIFGPTGITAYLAIQQQMKNLNKNINIVISSAAGATSIAFIQYSIQKGFKNIVGIAGSDQKCKFVKQKLKAIHCINYKKQNIKNEVLKIFPNGANLYFDNIGQQILDSMLSCMAIQSKIILCGATATYAKWHSKSGISNYFQIILRRIQLVGILYFHNKNTIIEHLFNMIELVETQKLQGYQTIIKGIENTPNALKSVYEGEYTGKTIIQFDDNNTKL